MIRITTILWVLLLTVAAGTVMHVSYQVRHVQGHLADLGREVQHEQDAIRILGAEWDTLNEPRRVDGLAKRFLALQSTPIQRVVALEDIPFKPTAEELAAAPAAAGRKGQGKARSPALSPTAKAPAIEVRATEPVRPPATLHEAPSVTTVPDGIGLILARAERRE
jgi:hypothetical protein